MFSKNKSPEHTRPRRTRGFLGNLLIGAAGVSALWGLGNAATEAASAVDTMGRIVVQDAHADEAKRIADVVRNPPAYYGEEVTVELAAYQRENPVPDPQEKQTLITEFHQHTKNAEHSGGATLLTTFGLGLGGLVIRAVRRDTSATPILEESVQRKVHSTMAVQVALLEDRQQYPIEQRPSGEWVTRAWIDSHGGHSSITTQTLPAFSAA